MTNAPMKIAALLPAGTDLRRMLRPLRRLGLDGISIHADALDLPALSHSGRREVRRLIERQELVPAALRADAPGKGLVGSFDAAHLLEVLRQALEGAREIGFAIVACDLGRLPRMADPDDPDRPATPAAEGSPGATGRDGPRDATSLSPAGQRAGRLLLPTTDDIARFVGADASSHDPAGPPEDPAAALELLRELAALADRVDLPLALGASLARPADLRRLLLMVDSPHFGRELDTASLLGEDVPALVVAEPPALHVVARDAQRGDAGRMRNVPPGEGEVDWPAWHSALDEADFAGFMTLDVPPTDLRRALAAIRPDRG